MRRINGELRHDWYSDKNQQKEIMPEDSDKPSMQRGQWYHWKLMLGNKKRTMAWCPKCVDENLDKMPPCQQVDAELGENPEMDMNLSDGTSISLEERP
jgi:hypothetical protein